MITFFQNLRKYKSDNWTKYLLGPYGSLIPCTVSKKTNKWIPKKVCYKQRNELTDRPTDRFKFMGPCKGSKK